VSDVKSSKQVTIPLQSVELADVIGTGERSIESFDDLHAAAAPRARWFLVGGAQILVIITVAIRRRKRHIKQPATERELVSAMAVGKKAVMTNALEAVRQDVKEETTDEFGDLKSQDRAILSATLPSAFRSESDVRLVEIDQAVVSDCDAVSVPGKIAQYLLGATQSLFGIDLPLRCAQVREGGSECLPLVETDELSKEFQFPGIDSCSQTVQEQPPEEIG
jgi:hypothetical protein